MEVGGTGIIQYVTVTVDHGTGYRDPGYRTPVRRYEKVVYYGKCSTCDRHPVSSFAHLIAHSKYAAALTEHSAEYATNCQVRGKCAEQAYNWTLCCDEQRAFIVFTGRYCH